MHTQTHIAHPASEIIFKKRSLHIVITENSVLTPPISPNFVNFLEKKNPLIYSSQKSAF